VNATCYPNFEIVVIDNQSDEPELHVLLRTFERQGYARTFRYDKPFNHSDMHNQVVSTVDAEMIVLVNNDVYDFSPGWLEQLVATVQLDRNVAGAGGKLLFPDGTIQHAGVAVGAGGLAGHACYGVPKDQPGYLGRDRSLQQVAAVTGALMIIRKNAFEAVGGFDATRYPTSYNDVDLWLRLGERGYRCLYNPEVQAVHEESRTRGVSPNESEYRRRLQEDLARSQYIDPFWDLDLFDDHPTRVRREGSAQWVITKLAALEEQAKMLSGIEPVGADPPLSISGSSSDLRKAA
jgi:GT2 family glycosyltransferase